MKGSVYGTCAVLLIALAGQLSMAAETAAPVEKGGPFAGGRTMNAREKSDCKLAVRLSARLMRIKGQISKQDLQTVLNATDTKDAWEVCCEHIGDMVCEDAMQGKNPKVNAPGGWLQWILDNFPQIMQMIMQIIALFSQDMPATDMQYVADYGEVMLCSLVDEAPVLEYSTGPCAAGACRGQVVTSAPVVVGQPIRNVGRVWGASRQARLSEGRWVAGRGVARVVRGIGRLIRGCGCN